MLRASANLRAAAAVRPATPATSTLPRRRSASVCTRPMKPIPKMATFSFFIIYEGRASASPLFLRIHQYFNRLLFIAEAKGGLPVRDGKPGGDQIVQPNATLGIDLHHAFPGASGIADGAGHRQLLVKDQVDRELNILSADGDLGVAPHGAKGFEASADGAGMPGTLEGHIYTHSAGVLLDGFVEAYLAYVDHGCRADTERRIQSFRVARSTG